MEISQTKERGKNRLRLMLDSRCNNSLSAQTTSADFNKCGFVWI